MFVGFRLEIGFNSSKNVSNALSNGCVYYPITVALWKDPIHK